MLIRSSKLLCKKEDWHFIYLLKSTKDFLSPSKLLFKHGNLWLSENISFRFFFALFNIFFCSLSSLPEFGIFFLWPLSHFLIVVFNHKRWHNGNKLSLKPTPVITWTSEKAATWLSSRLVLELVWMCCRYWPQYDCLTHVPGVTQRLPVLQPCLILRKKTF